MFDVGSTYKTRDGIWSVKIIMNNGNYMIGQFNNGSYGIFDAEEANEGECLSTTNCKNVMDDNWDLINPDKVCIHCGK